MNTKEYMRETTMTERDRLWEEIEESLGMTGARLIDEFLEQMTKEDIDDTDTFRGKATTFKESSMPGKAWWEEAFESYYYDIEYCYFADRWLKEMEH